MNPRRLLAALVAVVSAAWYHVSVSWGGVNARSTAGEKLRLAVGLLLAAWLWAGCAVNRPEFSEKTIASDGASTERRLTVSTWSLWPASTDLAKQRASLGKTFTLGTSDLGQEGGGTNVVETLRALDSILGKLRP